MSDNSRKRKPASDNAPTGKRPRFPQRPQHVIGASSTSTAYPNGEIDVKKFMRAHENEIKSLENAMKAAKKGMSRRAFQEVPRELRRRTASHNPQRVPKRLRARAKKEAVEDNTPTSRGKSGSGIGKGKTKFLRKDGIEKSRRQAWEARVKRRKEKSEGTAKVEPQDDAGRSKSKQPKRKFQATLATPETPPSRFRRRQLDKTWLPTHLWHTKRARMTPPKEPLWRFAIPLSPVAKAYRLTHRAAALRGAVAWDMSYMSTISLEGVEASIVGLLKSLKFAREDGEAPWQDNRKAKKWRGGTRTWEGWIYEREAKLPKKIAYTTLIWCAGTSGSSKRKVFIRVHPGAFFQLWEELIRASKVQKPAVTVEDLRFEIGSIEIMGPAAAEALCSILSPSLSGGASPDTLQSLWSTLAAVTDPGVLPPNALVAFPISDPRLRDPPERLDTSQVSEVQLTEILASWPLDQAIDSPGIFSRNARLVAGRLLPSQKSINRRKSVADLGQYPEARPTDPQIPMLTYISNSTKSWTVLLPWKCVMPVWRGIMRYPVSTGGNVRFGGLAQRRQVDFERSLPCFPYDSPGTAAGLDWEKQERVEREQEWTKRPRGKRIEWSSIDLGNGRRGEVGDPWACDWDRLLDAPTEGQRTFRQVPSKQASELTKGRVLDPEYISSPHLFTAKITMIGRGTPTTCARVYRLPRNNGELQQKWVQLRANARSASGSSPASSTPNKKKGQGTPKHLRNRELAQRLLEPRQLHGPPKAGDDNYPVVPDEEDLIGFVTTGNYNLAEGMPTAIANLALHRVFGFDEGVGKTLQERDRVCIVRGAGQTRNLPASMSEDRPADEQAEGVRLPVKLSPDVLAELTKDILEDTLSNIIFSTALACHRSEKVLRMQSAATQAESLALANLEPQSQTKGAAASQPSVPTAETSAARYENGRVFLKGNPLKTTPEIICPHCKLPRLMHPIMGKGMQTPDLTKEYCMLYPWVQRQGHDVYGNPFPTDMAKSKKERELIKQQQKNAEKESVGTPGSQDTDMAGGESQGKEIKLNTGGKPASYIPWHTCPNCKRSLLITRFAQHLEKCLGISGRQSSRNAMAKLAGQNGNGSGTGVGNTPLGSRMGTPAPGSQGGDVAVPKAKGKGVSPVKKLGDEDDDIENDTPEKKKKKKSSYIKKADREKLLKDGGSSLKVKLKTSNKDPDRKASESSDKPEGKRDREDTNDPDGAPKAKKIKLSMKGDHGSAPPRASAEPITKEEPKGD
ncbi:hypothetical protein BS50DRAFT_490046 [Corynespora cassiicola Philippines]|uniref:SAGA-associated factor 11 n=1 Tax=Corynespora cassiicola Philippines TaxID=1448308 RepID=A0A2T2NUH5_CORCC|nr:hypothetical protein BS50DRAFT_490046 [Corynespora cassiicola Philippines]